MGMKNEMMEGNLVKARFIISDTVQDVDCRAIITEKICNSRLNGVPRNLPDGRVEVILEGEIERFIEELREELPKRLQKPPNPGIEFSKIEYSDKLIVPDTMRASQGLLIGQLNKGIELLGVLPEKMAEGLRPDFNKLNERFNELPGKIAEELKKVLK